MRNKNYSRQILPFAVACAVCICVLSSGFIFGQSQPTRSDNTKKKETASECVNTETRPGKPATFVLVNVETPKCKQAIDSLKAGAVLINGWGKDGADMTYGLGLWLIEIASNPTLKSKFDE